MYKGDFKMCSYLGAAEHLNMNCPRGPGTPKPCKTNGFEGGPEAPGTIHIHMFGGAEYPTAMFVGAMRHSAFWYCHRHQNAMLLQTKGAKKTKLEP